MPATPGDGHQQADMGEPKMGHKGNGKQKLTEEDRMLKEIAQQKELLDAMPGDSYSDICAKAPHAKKLGQLEFSCQLTMEKQRLSSVLVKFEEEHGPLYSEPCLICLEDIHIYASANLAEFFVCCGGFICELCATRYINGTEIGFDKCPLCRESIGNMNEAEAAVQLLVLAKRGVSWAQNDVGRRMVQGNAMFKKQEKTGLKWLNKAAAQNHPPALYSLATFYGDGMGHVIRKSEDKAKELLLKSANLGYAPANFCLSSYYSSGKDGFENDPDESYFRASVAIALNSTFFQAAFRLGLSHNCQDLPEPSPYLACYYLNVAANGDDDGSVCLIYSQALVKLSEHIHDGSIAIPGSDVMPALLFWLRKSRDLGYNYAREMLKKWESHGQSQCAHCGKKAQGGGKFKQCSKCKSQWYCSKECQVEAWKAGHKNDCKRARMLKFEDYLNAE